MPKFTAVLRVYQNSKYDGTSTLADLDDLLDENDQSVGEDHPLWDADFVDVASNLFLWTDNPSVYGTPDEVHNLFGHKLTYEDTQTNEYGKYKDGSTNYDVQYLKLEFEANPVGDTWELVLPLAELVFGQAELKEDTTVALFGYFDGERPPTQEQVDVYYVWCGDLRKEGKLKFPSNLNWTTVVLDQTPQPNVLSERAKLKRYLLGYFS